MQHFRVLVKLKDGAKTRTSGAFSPICFSRCGKLLNFLCALHCQATVPIKKSQLNHIFRAYRDL